MFIDDTPYIKALKLKIEKDGHAMANLSLLHKLTKDYTGKTWSDEQVMYGVAGLLGVEYGELQGGSVIFSKDGTFPCYSHPHRRG